MSKEQSESPESVGATVATKVPEKPDAEVARWIKNLGALVTIFAALAGIWLTVYQFRLKAQADKDAAFNNRLAEDDKLKLGTLQINDQVASRKDQSVQRSADNAVELHKHELDIRHEERTASDVDAKSEELTLSNIIQEIFAAKASAEGSLALLFGHISRDRQTTSTIENAVLARLENPKSLGEIDLGFRLLEKIGVPAIDSIVQANLSARHRYDAYFVTADEDLKRLRQAEYEKGIGKSERRAARRN
jgi:hypothetical protein